MLIGSLGIGAPMVIYLAMGERSQAVLARLKDWMGRNNAVIMSILCLVIGAKLIGEAIGGSPGNGCQYRDAGRRRARSRQSE